MAHIKGEWGTSINVSDDEYEVEISFVEPQMRTLSRRISHRDAAALRDALSEIVQRRL